MKEMELTWAITSKGPRYFSAIFLEGWAVWMLSDVMKTLSPILKSSSRVWHLLAETEYHFCASEMWDQVVGAGCQGRLQTLRPW